MIFYFHVNKTHFLNKGLALSLVLKAKVFGTRKWPIRIKGISEKYSSHLQLKFPIKVCRFYTLSPTFSGVWLDVHH